MVYKDVNTIPYSGMITIMVYTDVYIMVYKWYKMARYDIRVAYDGLLVWDNWSLWGCVGYDLAQYRHNKST